MSDPKDYEAPPIEVGSCSEMEVRHDDSEIRLPKDVSVVFDGRFGAPFKVTMDMWGEEWSCYLSDFQIAGRMATLAQAQEGGDEMVRLWIEAGHTVAQ